MPHFELKLGQVPEMGGVVAREGVAASIGDPVVKAGSAAKRQPALLPVAGDAAILLA